jgi:ABC-type uncharacterized transport system permease subunit
VDLYVHSPVHFHGVLHNQLRAGGTLRLSQAAVSAIRGVHRYVIIIKLLEIIFIIRWEPNWPQLNTQDVYALRLPVVCRYSFSFAVPFPPLYTYIRVCIFRPTQNDKTRKISY